MAMHGGRIAPSSQRDLDVTTDSIKSNGCISKKRDVENSFTRKTRQNI